MKALSVRNPWAALIARGQKTIEIRTWRTAYRGPLVIVASASPCSAEDRAEFNLPADVPRGCMVALCDLTDVRPARAGDARAACCDIDAGDYAWCLSNVRRLEPSPVRGRLNLYDVPDELVKLVSGLASGEPLQVAPAELAPRRVRRAVSSCGRDLTRC